MARSLILMYHRIAEPFSDPWRLSVSPDNFADQLAMLATARIDVVPLAELAQRRMNRWAGKCIAITFDDGYLDNLVVAAPELVRHDLPATLFVATGYIGSDRDFWWDRVVSILLTPGSLPVTLEVQAGPQLLAWNLGADATYSHDSARKHRHWKSREAPPTMRHVALLEIWNVLVDLGARDQDAALASLEAQAPRAEKDELAAPMTPEQLRQFAGLPGMTLGAHGHEHRSMLTMTDAEIVEEMELSRGALDRIVCANTTSVSYPQGRLDQRTKQAARTAGFRIGCTSLGQAVARTNDVLALPRVGVPDIDGPELAAKLRFFMEFTP